MDELTVKVMSSYCKMTEITDEGISCKLSLHRDSVFLFICLSTSETSLLMINIVLLARL